MSETKKLISTHEIINTHESLHTEQNKRESLDHKNNKKNNHIDLSSQIQVSTHLNTKLTHDLNTINHKDQCRICLGVLQSTLIGLSCNHFFCQSCWYDYCFDKIQTGIVHNITCMESYCKTILPSEFIIALIKDNKSLLNKYDKFNQRMIITGNPSIKVCPIVNCNGYASIDNSKKKDVECTEGHWFCYECNTQSHNGRQCYIDHSLNIQQWENNQMIKKCPKCHCLTEKNDGCNHMTCRSCAYEWCWLCLHECLATHYIEGICKGLQHASEYSMDNNPNISFKHTFLNCLKSYIAFIVLVLFGAFHFSKVLFYKNKHIGFTLHFKKWYLRYLLQMISHIIFLCNWICFQILTIPFFFIYLLPCLLYWPLFPVFMNEFYGLLEG